MIIDSVKIDDLGRNAEEAFVVFEERLRSVLLDLQSEDRARNRDINGNYEGAHEPERYYVSSIIAFLDEYNLDIDVQDISSVTDGEFLGYFNVFFNKINYARTRFKLRKYRIDSGDAATPISITANYKDEIHENLNTIRKIVNGHVDDTNKKEAIYRKIAALESEIDRDRTTVDAVFSRFIDLSRIVGECATNLEPLVQKLERVMAALGKGANRIPLLPKRDAPKLLSSNSNEGPSIAGASQLKNSRSDLDDEIPF